MITEAIILAARKEKDSEIPYPLLSFDAQSGENLLERTLRILRRNGISNIIIVAGYKAELFYKYEAQDVRVILNKDYKHTASMASLALANPYISSDFIVVESDVICEERAYTDIITTKKKNCLTIVSESGNGDEAFVETDGDIVASISKDIHRHNHIDGEMIGISKISHETFRKMLLKWESNRNPLVNYEYLFLDSTEKHERQFLKQRDLIWSDVDQASDMKLLQEKIYPQLRKKEDPFDTMNIIAHLQNIFPNKKFPNNFPVEYIGGMTNRNYKVTVDEHSFVLRIPGNGTEGMIQRANEGYNSRLTYKMGISPEISYINNDTGIKLTEFINDAETLSPTTIQRFDNLTQIASILRQLHKSSVRLKNEFNVFKEIQSYECLMHECGAEMYEGYYEFREKILKLEDKLNEVGVHIAPCHNDLVAENFIMSTGGKIYLIDWEYSGMNDPMWDIAAIFLESNFTEENQTLFLEKYFYPALVPDDIRYKITCYKVLCDFLWSIWTVVKEKQGDDFGTYGTDRFHRAIENYNKLIENEF